MKTAHIFENGVKVYDYQLLESQRERYKKRNVHEPDEENLFRAIIDALPKNGCYISVGSAIGYYPILARCLRKDINIHCFEPLSRHVQYFTENIQLNNLTPEDFGIHQAAVSTETGVVRFKDKSYGSSIAKIKSSRSTKRRIKSLLKKLIGKNTDQPLLEVEAIAIGEISERLGIRTIDLLQMDIQGAEKMVLESYFSKNGSGEAAIREFIIGTHGERTHRACAKLLLENSYTLTVDICDPQDQPDGIIVARNQGL